MNLLMEGDHVRYVGRSPGKSIEKEVVVFVEVS
jgi:hypothetical protein